MCGRRCAFRQPHAEAADVFGIVSATLYKVFDDIENLCLERVRIYAAVPDILTLHCELDLNSAPFESVLNVFRKRYFSAEPPLFGSVFIEKFLRDLRKLFRLSLTAVLS